MKLKDKVAIVTGAASGIGAASARLFAAEGCAACPGRPGQGRAGPGRGRHRGGRRQRHHPARRRQQRCRGARRRGAGHGEMGPHRRAADGGRHVDRRHGRCDRGGGVGPHLRGQRQGHLSLDPLRHPADDRRPGRAPSSPSARSSPSRARARTPPMSPPRAPSPPSPRPSPSTTPRRASASTR